MPRALWHIWGTHLEPLALGPGNRLALLCTDAHSLVVFRMVEFFVTFPCVAMCPRAVSVFLVAFRLCPARPALCAVVGGMLGLLLASTPVSAQPLRSSPALYLKVGAGLSDFAGDASGPDFGANRAATDARPLTGIEDLFDRRKFSAGGPFPYVLTGEVGYQVSPTLSTTLVYQFGQYPFVSGQSTRTRPRLPDLGTTRHTVHLLGRYHARAPAKTLRPYLDVGVNVTLGGHRAAVGPSAGAGLEAWVGPRTALFLETRFAVTLGDDATDGIDRGAQPDLLSALPSLGIRYTFRSSPPPPRPQSLRTLGAAALPQQPVRTPVRAPVPAPAPIRAPGERGAGRAAPSAVLPQAQPARPALCATIRTFNTVYFAPGSAALSPAAQEKLRENADVFHMCPVLSIRIRGAAAPGETRGAQRATRRAHAVSAFYENAGVQPHRLRIDRSAVLAPASRMKGDAAALRRVETLFHSRSYTAIPHPE